MVNMHTSTTGIHIKYCKQTLMTVLKSYVIKHEISGASFGVFMLLTLTYQINRDRWDINEYHK